jgi:hypothetical protein
MAAVSNKKTPRTQGAQRQRRAAVAVNRTQAAAPPPAEAEAAPQDTAAAAAAETGQPAAPQPLIDGTFAIYQHNGGFLIAWRKRGQGITRHLPVPPFVLQMAAQASGKTIDDIIGELAGLGKDEPQEGEAA